jgi:hypothetical protein
VVLLRLVLRRHQRRRRHGRTPVYVNLHRVPAGRAALVDVERTALPTLIDQTITNEYKPKRSAAQVRLGRARLASGGRGAAHGCIRGTRDMLLLWRRLHGLCSRVQRWLHSVFRDCFCRISSSESRVTSKNRVFSSCGRRKKEDGRRGEEGEEKGLAAEARRLA